MPLDQSFLESSLRPIFDPQTMPAADVTSAVDAWCRAYVPYASLATAGGTFPSAPLAYQVSGGDFISALDATLRTMWQLVVWVGPGLTGVTVAVPPLQPYLLALTPTLISSPDPGLGLSLIAAAIHTYTLSITVSVVPPSGTPVIVPLL